MTWLRPIASRTCAQLGCGAVFEARHAKYCEKCRHDLKSRPSPKKLYFWTPERDAIMVARYDSNVRGRANEIAQRLGFPAWLVKRRAAHLGLSRLTTESRQPWTPTEEAILSEWAGRRTLEQIRRRFFPHRTLTSLVLKIKRMQLSRRVDPGGYTINELEQAMGHDHRLIHRWVREGRLKAKREGAVHGQSWIFTPEAVLDFIRNNPSAFRLDRVDQVWFLDLVFGTAAVGKEALKQVAA